MDKGDPIIIKEIHEGVVIETFDNGRETLTGKERREFKNADHFLKWLKQHFSIFEVSKVI